MWFVVDTLGAVEGEVYSHPHGANRAMMILNAHELKHGRLAKYTVQPTITLAPVDELNLPDWALEALKHSKIEDWTLEMLKPLITKEP